MFGDLFSRVAVQQEILNRWTENCTELYNTGPLEIHQYWTVPTQTPRMTIPFFAKKWRLQYNHRRKGSQLESTTAQQNWSKQVERM